MTNSKTDISNEIDHLFRTEYAKLVSVLTRTFGPSNIQLAEDVVQESMLEALNKWHYDGVPNNPVGWIYKVAKNKALNILGREKYKRAYVSDVLYQLNSEWAMETTLDHLFTEKEIADDHLSRFTNRFDIKNTVWI